MSRAAVLLAVMLGAAAAAQAQESRIFNPIGRPQQPGAAAQPAAAPLAAPPPAAVKEVVAPSVDRFAKSWNTPALGALLSPAFYDRDRVMDALVTKVPRDAVLRVLDVQSARVLSQEVRPTSNGLESEVVTRISVVLRTQVEFNDPVAGFQRREGLNEAIFVLREVQ